MTITLARVTLAPGQQLTIIYANATTPSTVGPYRFAAKERSSPAGTLTALARSPAVQVTCPDGAGTMAVSPAKVAASRIHTLIFTYTAGPCGVQAGG